jgi:hypothetical protein
MRSKDSEPKLDHENRQLDLEERRLTQEADLKKKDLDWQEASLTSPDYSPGA